jgi:hypothetical protein
MKKVSSWSLLALAILAVAAFLLNYQNTQAHTANSNTSLTVFEHSTHTKTINVGSKHDKRGDYYIFDNAVFNADDKNKIGLSEGLCTFTNNTITQCDWTLLLPSGNITISGAAPDAGITTSYAVTGGTGNYSQAHGEVVLQYMQAKKEYKYTLHID